MKPVIQKDEWLTSFLGKPAYHLKGNPEKIAISDLPDSKCFIDAKVFVEDICNVSHLLNIGFKVVDTNIQLYREPDKASLPSLHTRFARPEDVKQVRTLARDSFSFSRFHLDPEIAEMVASQIKEAWAGNFFTGKRGQWMVVAEEKNDVTGFLQLLRKADNQIIIDLIAVADESRGKGMAKDMIHFASSACLGRETAMQVGTQVANIPSLRLYTSMGFRIVSAEYVFHLHKQG